MACYCCERVGRLLSEVCDELVWRWFGEDLLDLHGRHVVSVAVATGRGRMTTPHRPDRRGGTSKR